MAEFDFLQGCLARPCSPLRKDLDLALATPFVQAKIGEAQRFITVGNNSDPPFNYAAINSFKMTALKGSGGGGGGFKMNLEITDEAGGRFDNFYNSLLIPDDFKRDADVKQAQVEVTWGWMGQSCNNQPVVISKTTHHGILMTIDTTFINGLIKFELEIVDLSQSGVQTSSTETIGEDESEKTIELKDAIVQICKDYNCEVEFLVAPSISPGETWDFKDVEPKDKWPLNGTNFLQTIMSWIGSYRADVGGDKGSGIFPMFDSNGTLEDKHKLILWALDEDCQKTIDPCQFGLNLGTYVINGGKHSPVIEFSPKLSSVFTNSTKGNKAVNPEAEDDELKIDDEPDCNMDEEAKKNKINIGFPIYPVVTTDAMRAYGLKNALGGTRQSLAKHVRANNPFKGGIEADLKIIGDPTLANFTQTGFFFSIIVNNPYHFTQEGSNNGVGDWLQAEPCHIYFSNKKWMYQGFSHEISGGKYTTTLQLRLDIPGININQNVGIGGDSGAITT